MQTYKHQKDDPFVRHEPCPKCGSRDALARYSSGSAHCFASGCNHHEQSNGNVVTLQPQPRRPLEDMTASGVIAAIPDRRLSQETCRKYGVMVEYNAAGEIAKHIYPYYLSLIHI